MASADWPRRSGASECLAFGVHRLAFGVWRAQGAVRTSVTLLGQDIGNTVTVLVHDLILSSANWYRTTNWRPDFSIIAPGPVEFRRRTHSQRFVRALPVKLLSPQLQRLWRCSLSQAFQLFSDVPMQPFVPSVILRMRRSTSFQIDPQGHPTTPTTGSTRARPARWQRAPHCPIGSLQVNRVFERSAQRPHAPSGCAHCPSLAAPAGNG
jgi:hypothetical protein